ncbi:hypothetical protein DL96DRAFT_1581355, partial [Flagelloscypha sp. PMI_526]
MIFSSLTTKKLLPFSIPYFGENEPTRDTVSLPAELWGRILLLVDFELLWQLRTLRSVFREAALDRKFRTLDLSFVSNEYLDKQKNSWKARLDSLDKLLSWIEQPYIFRRITSVVITPHLEYALDPEFAQQPSSLSHGILGRDRRHSGPSHPKKERARVLHTTARIMRLCTALLPLTQITRLKIISLARTHFHGETSYSHYPPRPECEYITFLLNALSPHLQHLDFKLSAGAHKGHHAEGIDFEQFATMTFPLLGTFDIYFSFPTLWCIPYLLPTFRRSPGLHTVKIGCWLQFSRWQPPIPTPVCIAGEFISTVRTLAIYGSVAAGGGEIHLDLLPILQQIEDFIYIKALGSTARYIGHLNPRCLRRLVLGTSGSADSLYSEIFEKLGGADSVLKELVMYTQNAHLDEITMDLPVFPRLAHLSLHCSSWDTQLLTRLPESAPRLKTLSLRACNHILLQNSAITRRLGVEVLTGFSERLAGDIEMMKCDLWSGWGLEEVEFSTRSDISLALPMSAFAKRLKNCRGVTYTLY